MRGAPIQSKQAQHRRRPLGRLASGPITFQLRDQLGLISTLALLSRTHKTAVAIFLDGPQHADDPTCDDYRWPQ